VILILTVISRNCLCIGKVMNRVYGSRDHDCFLVHGRLATMGRRGCFRAREVVVIPRREIEGEEEKEEVVRLLTNGATWRRSCGDDHTTVLNRGSRWCSDGEMVLGVRMRDWSQGGYDG
jgi:hypothetical protein